MGILRRWRGGMGGMGGMGGGVGVGVWGVCLSVGIVVYRMNDSLI